MWKSKEKLNFGCLIEQLYTITSQKLLVFAGMCKETDIQKCRVYFKASITSLVVIAVKVRG